MQYYYWMFKRNNIYTNINYDQIKNKFKKKVILIHCTRFNGFKKAGNSPMFPFGVSYFSYFHLFLCWHKIMLIDLPISDPCNFKEDIILLWAYP